VRVFEDVHQRIRLTSRIPFHPREASLPPPSLAGFMRGSPGIRRNSMQATPRSRPSLCAKVNFRENGDPRPAEGASRSPPLEPQPQMNRQGQGQDPLLVHNLIRSRVLLRMAGVEL
jgi:hypothetical protein